ncbi:hypothetical protein EVAR_18019_1 [Eumeta japonica]|uniref:Uncharacterized protein n=1 Tax=Eumeta variegata TaxID=151549 RepID=A0A4C1ZPT2_EUMVA|nr:hypothetical protein EVAR_18019_1 [Eumeta japonica]
MKQRLLQLVLSGGRRVPFTFYLSLSLLGGLTMPVEGRASLALIVSAYVSGAGVFPVTRRAGTSFFVVRDERRISRLRQIAVSAVGVRLRAWLRHFRVTLRKL